MKKLIQYNQFLSIVDFMTKHPIPSKGIQSSEYYKIYTKWALKNVGSVMCEDLFSVELSKYAKKIRRLIVNKVWVWYNK